MDMDISLLLTWEMLAVWNRSAGAGWLPEERGTFEIYLFLSFEHALTWTNYHCNSVRIWPGGQIRVSKSWSYLVDEYVWHPYRAGHSRMQIHVLSKWIFSLKAGFSTMKKNQWTFKFQYAWMAISNDFVSKFTKFQMLTFVQNIWGFRLPLTASSTRKYLFQLKDVW